MSSEEEPTILGAASELEAWRSFCRRIEALGEEIMSDEYPNDPADRPEAIAHLADQVSCWLGFAIGHMDTSAPFFHRSNDLVTQWGGPNQDNSYKHARIDPSRRYRIRGNMNSCEDFVMTLRAGFMHMEVWGTKFALTASDRGIRAGDSFELLLGGDGSDPDWIQISDEVTTVSLREYYLDWRPEEPAIFTIECLDPVPAPPRHTRERLLSQLEEAVHQTERSIGYWKDYMREHRAKGVDNQFALPMKLTKGFSSARYAFCFFELAPDEALLIESDVPDARYWNIQIASMAWFEQIDPVHRITSINQNQMQIDPDGRFRLALATGDPGIANWLDTGGHHQGLMTFRWFWPESDPTPTTKVVKLSEVAGLMPEDSPRPDAEAREREIRERKRHLAWRFRA